MNRIRRRSTLVLSGTLLLCLSSAHALVSFANRGLWPDTWPEELEPYRERSRSAFPGTGDDIMEDWHQVPVRSAEEFDRLWPVLLKLIDRGSTVTLNPIGLPGYFFGSPDWGYSEPVVRIFAPVTGPFGYPPGIDQNGQRISSERIEILRRAQRGETLTAEEAAALNQASIVDPIDLDPEAMRINNGRWVETAFPWPVDIRDENGALPEMVHFEDREGRIVWVAGPYPGWSHGVRCRIDLELVVDGEKIDPARFEVPDYLKIIDNRPVAKVPK